MDGQITQEKYQGMKTTGMNGTLKARRLRSLLMKKLHSQIMVHRPTQVWRKKTTSTSMPQEEQAFDSSSGSDDAPEQ
jgi:hypothetical protein